MALVLTEEQQLLKDTVQGFFREKAPVSQLRALRDRSDETGYDADTWQEMVELGLAGLMVEEDHGGTDFGTVGAGIAAAEAGRNLSASPMFASAVAAATAIRLAGSEDQKATWLPKIAAGDLVATLAIDEGARHAPERLKITSDGSTVSGLKTFVPDGHVADLILVVTRDSAGELGLVAVERGAAGLITDRTVMADSRNWAKITFENTPCVALPGGSTETVTKTLDIARAVLGSELIGICDECLEVTMGYLRERSQFGVAIGTFQALQHRAAHLYSEIEVARSAVLAAQQAADADSETLAVLASVAKGKASQAVELATNEAIQMHGGIGMTDEYDIGFYIKRARAVQQLYGDYGYHADRFARLSGY